MGSRPIDHGTQYDLTRKGETAKLNVYRTGKISTGGRASSLRDLLENWRTSQAGPSGARAPARPSGARPVLDGTPRLGIDEAGKGDYFGPLVVAGVRITGSEQAKELQKIGVRDSKEISVLDVRRISEIILETVGPENVRVASLSPGEYEARRVVAGNVNRLLGELDAAIIWNRSSPAACGSWCVPGPRTMRLSLRLPYWRGPGSSRRSNTSPSGSASGFPSAPRTSWMRAGGWSPSGEKTAWPRWPRPTSPPPAGCSNNVMGVTRDRSSQRHRDPSDEGHATGDARGARR